MHCDVMVESLNKDFLDSNLFCQIQFKFLVGEKFHSILENRRLLKVSFKPQFVIVSHRMMGKTGKMRGCKQA